MAFQVEKQLKELCFLSAPSGQERGALQKFSSMLEEYVDEITVDRMGNVLGLVRCGKPDAKKILLDAHIDEVSMIVTGQKEGFLQFQTVGGIDLRLLPNREVLILSEPPIFGVISCIPPHLQTGDDVGNTAGLESLYIDTGYGAEYTKQHVPPGTAVVFRNAGFLLGQNQFCAKALDDRSCLLALLLLAEKIRNVPLDVDVYFCASTREEVCYGGVTAAVWKCRPDCCIAIDVTHGATFDSGDGVDIQIGKGPAIGVGPSMTRWMSERMKAIAKEHQIPFQVEVMAGNNGTNAWDMQIAREGIPTVLLSLPLKYMHSPVEVIDRKDLEELVHLLTEFLLHPGEEALP